MRVPAFLIRYTNSFLVGFRQNQKKISKTVGRYLMIAYLIGMLVSMWFDREGLVALFLILMLDQFYSMEIATLRKEIRAKKMWHGGEQ